MTQQRAVARFRSIFYICFRLRLSSIQQSTRVRSPCSWRWLLCCFVPFFSIVAASGYQRLLLSSWALVLSSLVVLDSTRFYAAFLLYRSTSPGALDSTLIIVLPVNPTGGPLRNNARRDGHDKGQHGALEGPPLSACGTPASSGSTCRGVTLPASPAYAFPVCTAPPSKHFASINASLSNLGA